MMDDVAVVTTISGRSEEEKGQHHYRLPIDYCSCDSVNEPIFNLCRCQNCFPEIVKIGTWQNSKKKTDAKSRFKCSVNRLLVLSLFRSRRAMNLPSQLLHFFGQAINVALYLNRWKPSIYRKGTPRVATTYPKHTLHEERVFWPWTPAAKTRRLNKHSPKLEEKESKSLQRIQKYFNSCRT